MSAFYDIYIGGQSTLKPIYKRLENEDWVNTDKFGINTWLSLPGNRTYIQHLSTADADMIVLGQFYENVNLEQLLGSCLLYADNKCLTFQEPAGHYVLFIYHRLKREHHIFTNRLGTYHVYYSSINGQYSLSTYFIGLVKQASVKKLDWEGITGFMAIGYFPGNTTYIDGITLLEPASHYVFDCDLNMTKHNRYWTWEYEPYSESYSTSLDRLNYILEESLSYASRDKKIAIPISGGLDSRTLAGILTNGKCTYNSLWGFSYGYTDKSIETKIASKVALARKIEFNKYNVPVDIFSKADVLTDSVELFQYIDGTRQVFMKDMLCEKSDAVVCGHWGDVWLGGTGSDELTDEIYFRTKILKKGSNWLLQEVCKHYFPHSSSFLSNYFNEWSAKYKHINNIDFRRKIYKTEQWSFRWTLPGIRAYQSAVMPILPFYDNRIVDLFTSIDVSLVNNRKLQVDYIKNYHSDLAKIKWQEYGVNLYNYTRYNNRHISYRIFQKLKRTFLKEKPITRNWELFYLNTQGRQKLENILLHNNLFTDIVPVSKVRQLLDDFYEYPNAANGYKVSMLHTFAQFIKTAF